MIKILFLTYLYLPLQVFSQNPCGKLDYQAIIQPVLNNKSSFDSSLEILRSNRKNKKVYKNSETFNAETWSLHPIINIAPAENGLGFTFLITASTFIFNKRTKDPYEYNLSPPNFIIYKRRIPVLENRLNRKFESPIFVAFFLDNERSVYDIIAYCEGDHVIFKTNESDSAFSIEGIIKYRYGSIEKYKELYEDQEKMKSLLSILQPANLKEAKEIIVQDWNLHSKYAALDTAKNVSLLIHQIINSTQLSDEQIDLLRLKIAGFLNRYKNLNTQNMLICNLDFAIYNFDLHDIIADVLTKKQLAECELYFRALHRSFIRADDIILLNLINTNKITSEADRKALYEDEIRNLFK